MSSTSLYLPEALIQRVDEAAQREDRSRSYIVTRALEEWLERAIGHAGAAAASAHLAEHRRLAGLPAEEESR